MAPLLFIQVGGVQGLAQRWMSGLMASAAWMYGMSVCLSRLIENCAIVVSLARLVEGVAVEGVVAGADGDPSVREPRAVRRVEEQLHRAVSCRRR